MEEIRPTKSVDEERKEAKDFPLSGMTDNSAITVSVAIGLLGIIALYPIGQPTGLSWVFLTAAYWLVFLFGLQSFIFHQMNALVANRYIKKYYGKYKSDLDELADDIAFIRIVGRIYGFPEAGNDANEGDDKLPPVTSKEKQFFYLTIAFYGVVAFLMWFAVANPLRLT